MGQMILHFPQLKERTLWVVFNLLFVKLNKLDEICNFKSANFAKVVVHFMWSLIWRSQTLCTLRGSGYAELDFHTFKVDIMKYFETEM